MAGSLWGRIYEEVRRNLGLVGREIFRCVEEVLLLSRDFRVDCEVVCGIEFMQRGGIFVSCCGKLVRCRDGSPRRFWVTRLSVLN